MTAKSLARIEAIKSYSKVYYGKPCKKCFSTEKYVSNNSCVKCTILRSKNRKTSDEIIQKYIKSEKAKITRKKWRRSITNKTIQNNYLKKSGWFNLFIAKRRAIIYKAIEQLSQKEQKDIIQIFKTAKRLQKLTNITHHVDHILALADGGYHHPNNLRILTDIDHQIKTAQENRIRNKIKRGFN